jgi:DNA-binding CsgD family transcriptional regulator
MMGLSHALAIEVATRRLLRVALLFGLTGSLVALVTTLQQSAGLATVVLAAAWSLTWASASVRPQILIPVLRQWRWTMVLIAGLSTATILGSGGFGSLLKAEANWLAWAAPVLLGSGASLAVATILSGGLLAAFMLDGMSLRVIVSGPERYTAVTDILNPLIIVLAALAVTGVFRLVLINAASALWRARRGEAASSPAMRALLAGEPVLAPPTGNIEAVRDDRDKRLSPAERDIVERLARGQTPKQIAFARGVKKETVYDQIGSAKQKTGATTREHLIVLAWHPPT